MDVTTYLAVASGLVWAALAGYLVFLDRRAAGLERRLRQLALLAKEESGRD